MWLFKGVFTNHLTNMQLTFFFNMSVEPRCYQRCNPIARETIDKHLCLSLCSQVQLKRNHYFIYLNQCLETEPASPTQALQIGMANMLLCIFLLYLFILSSIHSFIHLLSLIISAHLGIYSVHASFTKDIRCLK